MKLQNLMNQTNVLRKIMTITILLSSFVLIESSVSLVTITLWKNSLSSSTPLDQLSLILDAATDIRFRLSNVLSDRLPIASTRRKAIESLEQISTNWKAYEADHDQLYSDKEVYQLTKSGYAYTKKTVEELLVAYENDDKTAIALALDEKWTKIITDFTNPVKKLYDEHALKIKETNDKSEKLTQKFIIGIIGLLSFAFLLSLYALYYLFKSKARIQNIINDLSTLGETVLKSSRELNSNADNLAGANDSNRQAIHETTSALEEINSIVQMTATSTKRSQEIIKTTSDSIQDGESAVRNLSDSMETIDKSTNSMVQQFEDVNAKLESFVTIFNDVAEKTKVINDIVFQTRLLSFNASVEAARAGEHGKGFAVVAQEIGALAQLSGNSSQEISKIITEGRDQVQLIANQVKEHSTNISKSATESVSAGNSSSQSISSAFEVITNNVNMIKTIMNELNTSTNEQTKGIGEVNISMRNINMSSEKSSQSIQVTTSESIRLKEQAENLFQSMAELDNLLTGKQTTAQQSTMQQTDEQQDDTSLIKHT